MRLEGGARSSQAFCTAGWLAWQLKDLKKCMKESREQYRYVFDEKNNIITYCKAQSGFSVILPL